MAGVERFRSWPSALRSNCLRPNNGSEYLAQFRWPAVGGTRNFARIAPRSGWSEIRIRPKPMEYWFCEERSNRAGERRDWPKELRPQHNNELRRRAAGFVSCRNKF